MNDLELERAKLKIISQLAQLQNDISKATNVSSVLFGLDNVERVAQQYKKHMESRQ